MLDARSNERRHPVQTHSKCRLNRFPSVSICRFIPQDGIPVDELVLKSCPPVIPAEKYIALDNALVYENDKDRHIFRHCVLCWSTRSTLPKWVQLSKELSEVRVGEF